MRKKRSGEHHNRKIVGRKSANLVLGDVFGKPAIVKECDLIITKPFLYSGLNTGRVLFLFLCCKLGF